MPVGTTNSCPILTLRPQIKFVPQEILGIVLFQFVILSRRFFFETLSFVCGEGTQGGTLSRPPQTCCSASSEASFYIFSRGATVAQNTMSTRSGPRLDPNAGCGVPLSPSSLVPQTPMSPSYLVPRPSSYNLDETMFVASVRKGYHEEFQQAIAEAMRVYAG